MCFGGSQPSSPPPNTPNYSLSDSEKGVSFEQTKPDGSKIAMPAPSEQKSDVASMAGTGLNVKGM